MRLPKAGRGHKKHIDALCQVAQMLSRRMGMPEGVSAVVGALTERWDGKGLPRGIRGEPSCRSRCGSATWHGTPPSRP